MFSAPRTNSRLSRSASTIGGLEQMASASVVQPAFRSPRRVTITLPFATFQDLQERADGEGRSLSNLAAFLLESSLHPGDGSRAQQEARRAAETMPRTANFR